MQDFVNKGGVTIEESKAVYVRNAPLVVPASEVKLEDDSHLTPAQRV
jgi:hypothetical protein